MSLDRGPFHCRPRSFWHFSNCYKEMLNVTKISMSTAAVWQCLEPACRFIKKIFLTPSLSGSFRSIWCFWSVFFYMCSVRIALHLWHLLFVFISVYTYIEVCAFPEICDICVLNLISFLNFLCRKTLCWCAITPWPTTVLRLCTTRKPSVCFSLGTNNSARYLYSACNLKFICIFQLIGPLKSYLVMSHLETVLFWFWHCSTLLQLILFVIFEIYHCYVILTLFSGQTDPHEENTELVGQPDVSWDWYRWVGQGIRGHALCSRWTKT